MYIIFRDAPQNIISQLIVGLISISISIYVSRFSIQILQFSTGSGSERHQQHSIMHEPWKIYIIYNKFVRFNERKWNNNSIHNSQMLTNELYKVIDSIHPSRHCWRYRKWKMVEQHNIHLNSILKHEPHGINNDCGESKRELKSQCKMYFNGNFVIYMRLGHSTCVLMKHSFKIFCCCWKHAWSNHCLETDIVIV